ncbi:hypothetical protein H0H92_008193 [Tricholoma furcatifolium]|nr:hypothetical protein H0H92_008193 [Tricholoma furcatifolium]
MFNHDPEAESDLSSDIRRLMDLLALKASIAGSLDFETCFIQWSGHDSYINKDSICAAVQRCSISCTSIMFSKFVPRQHLIYALTYWRKGFPLAPHKSLDVASPWPYRLLNGWAAILSGNAGRNRDSVLRYRTNEASFYPQRLQWCRKGTDFLQWLNMSELPSSYIRDLSVGPVLGWGDTCLPVLSKIVLSMPYLSSISMDAKGISPPDLLSFLAQLRQLEALIIVNSPRFGDFDRHWHLHHPRNDRHTFSSLHLIQAPPHYSATLLGNNLPSLSTLIIIDGPKSLFTSETQALLMTILSRSKTCKLLQYIELNVQFAEGFGSVRNSALAVQWMMAHLELHFKSNRSHVFSGGFENIGLSIDVDPLLHSRNDYSTMVFIQWIRMFKGIRSINFPSVERPSSEANIYHFLRALTIQCPKIQRVHFGLQRFYKLPDDLPEHKPGVTQHSVLHHKEFFDLDADTVYLIAEFLDGEDLFPLAMTCSNLCDWILPVYLRRTGYDASTGGVSLITTFPETSTLISALTLCRSVTTLSRLSFLIPHGVMSLFLILEYLHRFLRLLRRLSKIRVTIFDFGGPLAETANYDVMEHGAKARWRQLTFSILCVMAEKSECIAIGGLGQFGDLTNIHQAELSLGGGMPTLPITHSLRFIQVNASSLTLQIVREWIKLALPGNTTVEHLALPALSSVEAWFLPDIAETFSMIKSLTLAADSRGPALPADVLKLLCHLPLLETLELSPFEMFHDGFTLNFPPFKNPLPPLLNLHSLTCAPTFLEFIANNNLGPQLERVTVIVLDVDWANRGSIAHPLGSARIISKSIKGLRARATYSQPRIQLSMVYSTIWSVLQPEDFSDPVWASVKEETAEICIRRRFLQDVFELSHARLVLSRLNSWLNGFRKLQKLSLSDAKGLKHEMDTIIGKWDLITICPTLKEIHVGETILRHDGSLLAPGMTI